MAKKRWWIYTVLLIAFISICLGLTLWLAFRKTEDNNDKPRYNLWVSMLLHCIIGYLTIIYIFNFILVARVMICVRRSSHGELRKILKFRSSVWTYFLLFGDPFTNAFVNAYWNKMNAAVNSGDLDTVFIFLRYARLNNEELENGLAYIMKEFIYEEHLDQLIECYDNMYINPQLLRKASCVGNLMDKILCRTKRKAN